MLQLILLVVQQLVIPEVMEVIHQQQLAAAKAAGQPVPPMPTSEEVIAAFKARVLAGITTGTDWLASHPPTA